MILLGYIAVCFCAYWLIFIKTEGADPVKTEKRIKDSKKVKSEKELIRADAYNEGFLTGYELAYREIREKALEGLVKGREIQP